MFEACLTLLANSNRPTVRTLRPLSCHPRLLRFIGDRGLLHRQVEMRSNSALSLREQRVCTASLRRICSDHWRLSVACWRSIDRSREVELHGRRWSSADQMHNDGHPVSIVLHKPPIQESWCESRVQIGGANNLVPRARSSPNQGAPAGALLPPSSDRRRPDTPPFATDASSPIAIGLFRARQSNLSAASR
jgi:hypothetical protein